MKLFGILHHPKDGSLTVRNPKLLKVSIGLGKGKDVHVHINPLGKWLLSLGGKVTEYGSKDECLEAYRKLGAVPERKFPKKLPYFTFTHPSSDGGQEPDFDAIAAHGPMPSEIPIILTGTRDDIFKPAMQMWGKTELQCSGDGLIGQRLVALARTPEEKAKVVEGVRTFPVEPCFVGGCRFAQGDAPPCKPHASLSFQLEWFPVVGGVAGYDTTGYAGIKALGGVLERVIPDGASVDGLGMMMGLRQYVPRKGSGAAWHATLRCVGEPDGGADV